ncbi:hypothetical protein STHU_15910 [Allostella humosa]|nr:hypothetical protein STHU_15910 [Stella humosa]
MGRPFARLYPIRCGHPTWVWASAAARCGSDQEAEKFIETAVTHRSIVACGATCDILAMIASFRHKGLKRYFEDDDRSRLPAELVERVGAILAALDAAAAPEDMNRPSFRLHPLKGDRKGQWAVTVRANWRIVFGFAGGNAIDVDFVDYH